MSLPPTSRFDHGDETDPFSTPPVKTPPRRNAPAWIILGAAVVLLIVVISVVIAGGGDDRSPATPAIASTVTVERTVAPTTTTPSRTSSAPTSRPPADGAGIMPDVVCMNLQAAQDRIQKTGVFYSRSEDASGKGRMQLFDRNWIVVSQSPAAGTRIGEGDAVLSVVKTDEPNDC